MTLVVNPFSNYANGLIFSLIILAALPINASTSFAEKSDMETCYSIRPWNNYLLGEGEEIPNPPGMFVDLLIMASEQSDIKINLLRRPWKRCLSMLKKNKVSAIIGGSYLPERAEFSHYPMKVSGEIDPEKALQHSAYYLYLRSNLHSNWDDEKLQNIDLPIGVDLGFSAGNYLRDQGHEVEEFADTSFGFKLVHSNRLGGYVTFPNLAEAALSTEQYDIVQIEEPFLVKAYYLMIGREFYKDHPNKAERLWDALKKIRAEKNEELEAKYLSQ